MTSSSTVDDGRTRLESSNPSEQGEVDHDSDAEEEEEEEEEEREEEEREEDEGTAGEFEEGGHRRQRDAWFLEQRAWPSDHVPDGALERAWIEAQRLPAARRASTTEVAAVASTLPTLVWRPIGPKPIHGGSPSRYNGRAPWSGRITSVAHHPTNADIAYVGGAVGGVWKTLNAGATWTALFDKQPSLSVGSIAIHPTNAAIVYVGTGEANQANSYFGAGLFRSTNGGSSWTKVGGATFNNCYIAKVVVTPQGVVLVAASSTSGPRRPAGQCVTGVYRSNADGTFTRLLSSTSTFPTDIAVKPGIAGRWYAAFSGAGVWKTVAAGATWTKVGGGFPTATLGRIALATTAANPNRLYAAIGTPVGGTRGVWTSTNSGLTWSQVTAFGAFCDFVDTSTRGQCDYDLAVTAYPLDDTTVYAAGVRVQRVSGGVVSTLGFDNANPTGIHVDIHSLSFDAANRLWVGSDGGVYRKNPGTGPMDFVNLNAGLSVTQFNPGISGSLAGNSVLLGGTQDNGSLRYSAAACGTAVAPCWFEFDTGDGGYTAFDPVNVRRYSTYTFGEIHRYASDAYEGCLVRFFVRNADGSVPPGSRCKYLVEDAARFYAPMAMSPTNPRRVYVGATRLYFTEDADTAFSDPNLTDLNVGPTMFVLNKATGSTGFITAIAEAASNASVLYTGYSQGPSGNGVYVSTNGGDAWSTSTTPLPNRVITDITVKTNTAGTAWVALSGYGAGHVWLTQDFGATWTNASGNLPDVPVNAIEVDSRTSPSTLYAATDVGVFWSQDGGATWSSRVGGLPITVVVDLKLDTATNTLIAATHGRGAFTTPIPSTPPTITGIAPLAGPVGTTVTISGANFNYVQSVTFGGRAARFTRVSSTRISAVVPTNAITGKVRVITPGGTATSAATFTRT